MWGALTGAKTSFIYKDTHPLLVAWNCSALFHKCLRSGGTGGRKGRGGGAVQGWASAEAVSSDVCSHHDLQPPVQLYQSNLSPSVQCCNPSKSHNSSISAPAVHYFVYSPKVCISAACGLLRWSASSRTNSATDAAVFLFLLVLFPPPASAGSI